MESIYSMPPEETNPHGPVSKGKAVWMTIFADANLMHYVVPGRSASGILLFLTQTPIDWFLKLQGQVEVGKYGFEFNQREG